MAFILLKIGVQFLQIEEPCVKTNRGNGGSTHYSCLSLAWEIGAALIITNQGRFIRFWGTYKIRY